MGQSCPSTRGSLETSAMGGHQTMSAIQEWKKGVWCLQHWKVAGSWGTWGLDVSTWRASYTTNALMPGNTSLRKRTELYSSSAFDSPYSYIHPWTFVNTTSGSVLTVQAQRRKPASRKLTLPWWPATGHETASSPWSRSSCREVFADFIFLFSLGSQKID